MACFAQRLQLAQAERVPVATMRHNVVGDARWCRSAIVETERTERFDLELVLCSLPMAGELIPVAWSAWCGCRAQGERHRDKKEANPSNANAAAPCAFLALVQVREGLNFANNFPDQNKNALRADFCDRTQKPVPNSKVDGLASSVLRTRSSALQLKRVRQTASTGCRYFIDGTSTRVLRPSSSSNTKTRSRDIWPS